MFGILDLKTKALHRKDKQEIKFFNYTDCDFPITDCVVINDELHIFTGWVEECLHYFDEDEQQFVELQSIDLINYLQNEKIVHVPHQNQIMLFGESEVYEFCTKTNANQREKFEKCTNLKMPFENQDSCIFMNVFESLIAVFGSNRKFSSIKIAFLDLKTNEWFEKEVKFPIIPKCRIVDGKDNFVYFMKCSGNSTFALKAKWSDTIPNKLCKSYKKNIFKKLIYGFTLTVEMSHNFPFYFLLICFHCGAV